MTDTEIADAIILGKDDRDFYERVIRDGYTLSLVPVKYRDNEICRLAVETSWNNLVHVPEKMLTPEICMIAFHKNPKSVFDFPVEFLTEEVCMEAARRCPDDVHLFPEKFLTPELIETAIQSGGRIKQFPEEYINRELCLLAMKRNGLGLNEVPKRFMDYEICLEAVKQNGAALNDVPDRFLTKELCVLAMENRGDMMAVVEKRMPEVLTSELCLKIVEKKPCSLRSVPKRFLNDDILMTAFRGDPFAILFFPEEQKTEALIREAIQRNPSLFGYMEFRLQDNPRFVLELVRENPELCSGLNSTTKKILIEEVVDDKEQLYSIESEFFF